jgi:carboxymethylenebutenolidase
MQVTGSDVDVPVPGGVAVRCLVVRPAGGSPDRRWPAVLADSDIFQLTPPHVRMCRRLAAHGYVVVAPEIFARLEPPGSPLDFERDRQRALADTDRMELAWLDDDRRAVLGWMRAQPFIDPGRLLAAGWCIGGHLAFRAATEPDVRATACFYATGLHDDTVGKAKGTAPSLASAAAIRGALLLVWGTRDPHIPAAGRLKIQRALADAGIEPRVALYDAEHTFMRDEGARWEPVAADRAFADMLDLVAPFHDPR